MEEKKVMIYVRGEQYFEGVDPDATELISEGTMTIAGDGAITLVYEETELTGLEGTTTQFVIDDDTVVLTRYGALNSQMIFQRGKRHTSLYETPWGTMTVDIATASLAHRLDSHGGLLDIRYSIAVDHQVTGQNRFKIRVREIQGDTR